MVLASRAPLVAVIALAALATSGCGKSPRKRVPYDADPPPVPIDAARVHTPAERDAYFATIPTDKAIGLTIKRLAIAPHPAGSPENEAAAHEILATLGRLGVRTGVAEEQVLLPSFAGPMLVLDPKPRPIRNVLAIFEGSVQDAIIVGATFDANETTVAAHAHTAALLEIARGFAALQRAGWHPHRTIILAFWDGGTIGDQGISSWVADQHAMLSTNAIAYIDIGPLGGEPQPIQADPLLRTALSANFGGDDGSVFSVGSTAPAAPQVREGIPTVRWVTAGEVQPDDAIIAAAGHIARRAGGFVLNLADQTTPILDYDQLADSLEYDLGGRIDAKTRIAQDPAYAATLMALRMAAPDPDVSVSPACEHALIGALRAFLVDDGIAGRAWYRNLRIGWTPDTGEVLRHFPEMYAAQQADDRPALDRAGTRLIAAMQRATTILAPCARLAAP